MAASMIIDVLLPGTPSEEQILEVWRYKTEYQGRGRRTAVPFYKAATPNRIFKVSAEQRNMLKTGEVATIHVSPIYFKVNKVQQGHFSETHISRWMYGVVFPALCLVFLGFAILSGNRDNSITVLIQIVVYVLFYFLVI